MQNVTGTLAWGVSSLAFTSAVLFNKNIPSDQKKFLVPQEIADGLVNVSLFWIFTKQANNMAKEYLKKGKVFPNAIKEEVTKIKEKAGKDLNLEAVEKQLSPEAQKHMGRFKKSFPMVVSLAGSVLAANIVTPIIRNIVASKIQERSIHKESIKPVQSQITSRPNQQELYKHKTPQPFMAVKSVTSFSGQMKI